MDDTKKTAHIGYINPSKYGDGKLYGTLYWGEKKYRLNNFLADGKMTVADVQEETGQMRTAKNGNEYPEYANVGAIRFDRESGDGLFVTMLGSLTVKYAFTSSIEDKNGSPTRVMRFPTVSENKFRTAFDTASEVVSESPESSPVDDDIPY